jgi:tetratricopeptide (TPR) repeat protein
VFSRQSKIKKVIEEGDLLLEQDDLSGAEAAYNRALEIDPNNPGAIYSLGCIASNRGQFADAERYARRVLQINPSKQAAFLLGNALLGQERLSECLQVLLEANPDVDDIPPSVQIATLHERIGDDDSAEEAIRRLLEAHCASYNTRYAMFAMHSSAPFLADLHHALARILQRRGDREEAWLHYHLAKRIDPNLDLDPMYLDILTREDIENHPIFDRRQPAEPPSSDDLGERIKYVISKHDYAAFALAIKEVGLEDSLNEIGQAIQYLQHEGRFASSAIIRILGDTAEGKDVGVAFNWLRTDSWQRVFEISEQWYERRVNEEEVKRLATSFSMQPDSAIPLYWMAYRFLRLDPESGWFVTNVAAICLARSEDTTAQGIGKSLLAEAYSRNARIQEAIENYYAALELLPSNEYEQRLRVAERLFNRLLERKDFEKALEMCSGFVTTVQGNGYERAAALILLTRCLYFAGNIGAAYESAIEAADIGRRVELPEHVNQFLAEFLTDTAQKLGMPEPSTITNEFAKDQSPHKKLEHAHRLFAEGNVETALSIVGVVEQQALAASDITTLVSALHLKSEMFAKSERLTEARAALEEAIDRANPIETQIKIWPFALVASSLAEAQDDASAAVELAERALSYAVRSGSEEGQTEAHQALARLLVDSEPERALAHFERAMKGGALEHLAPSAINQAADAFREGRYAEAAGIYENILTDSNDEHERYVASMNLSSALYQLGSPDRACDVLVNLSDELTDPDRTKDRISALLQAIKILQSMDHPANPIVQRLHEALSQVTNEGRDQTLMLEVAGAFADLGLHGDAEKYATDALQISRSEAGKNTNDELMALCELGRIYRSTAHYPQAIECYDQAIEIAKRLGDQSNQGKAIGWRAVAQRYAGNPDQARDDYDKAISIALRLGEDGLAASHRFNSASLLLDLGLRAEALKRTIEALEVAERLHIAPIVSRAAQFINIYWRQSELPAELLERVQKVLSATANTLDSGARTLTLYQRAHDLPEDCPIEQITGIFEEIFEIHRAMGDAYNFAAAHLNLGRELLKRSPEESVRWLAEGRRLAEEIPHFALATECEEQLLRYAIEIADSELVEEYLESLRKAWYHLRSTVSSDEDRIRVSAPMARATQAAAAFFVEQGRVPVAINALEMTRANALNDLLLRRDDAMGTGDPIENPFSLSKALALTASHNAKSVLLWIEIMHGSLHCLVARHEEEPQQIRIELDSNSLEEWANVFRLEIHDQHGYGFQSWLGHAETLGSALDAYIREGDSVFIFANEQLQFLPFSALPMPDGRPLLSRAATTFVPSLNVLRQLVERPVNSGEVVGGVVAIGCAFPDEALLVQRTYGGITITGNHLDKPQILELVQRARLVHFSCHGRFDSSIPKLSGLHLRAPRSHLLRDILTVQDLTDWHFNCELMTLSACESGLGHASAGSENTGLTRSMLAAGSRSVLSTLWSVDAAATEAFMIAFYKELRNAKDAGGKIDASRCVRAAQLTLIKRPVFEWAAFRLTGWPFLSLMDQNDLVGK